MVIHMQLIRKNAFGGMTNTTLCNRMRCTFDGMNLTDKKEKVTCKFCLKLLDSMSKRE